MSGGQRGGGITLPTQEPTALDVTEYLVVGFNPKAPQEVIYYHRARDAAEMQQAVEQLRKSMLYTGISVFKRMLQMKAKTEWETTDADV